MCRRESPTYSAIVASESSDEISPSEVAPGYWLSRARRSSRKRRFSGCVLLYQWYWYAYGLSALKPRPVRSSAGLGGLSRSFASWKQKLMASRRKPSTPRSSQNLTLSSVAACTAGLWKFRSGCEARKLCRKYCSRRGSQRQATPPKIDNQLLGGVPSGRGSAHTYQSCFGLSREARLSVNQSCSIEVWLSTWSIITRRPSACALASRRSKSSSVPNNGSTAR